MKVRRGGLRRVSAGIDVTRGFSGGLIQPSAGNREVVAENVGLV